MTDAVRLDSFAPGVAGSNELTGDDSPSCDASLQQFHILADIANFTELRRHLGCERAELLVGDIADRIAGSLPHAAIKPVGRTMLGVWIFGSDAKTFDAQLRRVKRALAKPFDLDGERHVIAVDIGVASAPLLGADDVRIAEEAEAALAEARLAHRSIVHRLDQQAGADAALALELARAIDAGEMLLMYQPKVHVRRQEIASAEGLVRWRHPERGLILPGEFIPLAESSDQIDRLTLWTIRQAIADQQELVRRGHDLRLFINISGQLLADADFVARVCDLIGETDARLGFEITETSVISDPQTAIRNLQIFADFGITIAIDDYGAGLSSLAYLKQLPARELKIDKLFVTQLTSSNRDPLIVRSTIDLAHALDMEVVAEGVETHAALALLSVMGCDMVQGFLISRPIALEALIRFLADGGNRSVPQDARATFLGLAKGWKNS